MKYMLLMYASDSEGPSTPEEQEAVQATWAAPLKDMKTAGVLESTGGLPAGNATTIRVRDGKALTTGGPFIETHEQLGGYFLLNCEDLDEAIAWAAKIPFAHGGAAQPAWRLRAGGGRAAGRADQCAGTLGERRRSAQPWRVADDRRQTARHRPLTPRLNPGAQDGPARPARR